jgi:hypothetical protein
MLRKLIVPLLLALAALAAAPRSPGLPLAIAREADTDGR